MKEYLIWSNEHRAWWGPGRVGYTPHVGAAGTYTREEALKISGNAMLGWREDGPPPELPVRVEDAREVFGAWVQARRTS